MTDKTTFDGVELDDHVMELLMDLAAATHCEPKKLISSIVSDVLIDEAISDGRIRKRVAAVSHTTH